MNTKLVTDYGQLAPLQGVEEEDFDLRKFATRRVDPAVEVVSQQNAQLNQQMAQAFGEKSKGLGFSSSPVSEGQTDPYNAYTIDQAALDNETTLLKMYQQEALLKQKEGEFYSNLADEYGNMTNDGDGSSGGSIDFSSIPDDQKSFLTTLAQVESGGKNITTPNKSGYVGIYQFRYREGDEGSMWAKKFGVTAKQMINSPELQQKAMSSALKRYDIQLAKSNIPVNNYTRWLRHNQGLGGARAIVSGKLTNIIRRNIRNQGISGKSDYELIQNYHQKFKPRFTGSGAYSSKKTSVQPSAPTPKQSVPAVKQGTQLKYFSQNQDGTYTFALPDSAGVISKNIFTKDQHNTLLSLLSQKHQTYPESAPGGNMYWAWLNNK